MGGAKLEWEKSSGLSQILVVRAVLPTILAEHESGEEDITLVIRVWSACAFSARERSNKRTTSRPNFLHNLES